MCINGKNSKCKQVLSQLFTTIGTVHDSKKNITTRNNFSSNSQKTFNTYNKKYIYMFKNYIDWTIVQNSFNLLCGFPIS